MITLRAIGFAPIYLDNPDEYDECDDIYGQLVVIQQNVTNENTVLLRDSFHLDPNLASNQNDAKLVHVHRFGRSVVLEPNNIYKVQVELMIPKKDAIFCRTKLIQAGKHRYNRSSGDPTEILFDGCSSIASLGVAVEYIDTGIIRPMMIDETQ